VNCGAIPEQLFESELFGHEKGAFTGAVSARVGRFELADGGPLFLDEVGELPPDLQVKLLRVLQERAFERVGGHRSRRVDVRMVAATNRDLKAMIRDGSFRQDLYYRLAVIPIHLPPLRERLDDIPHLVELFIERFNDRLGLSITGISPEALDALRRAAWPGNIRELENVMERSMLLSRGERLRPEDLLGLDEPQREATPDLEEAPLKEVVRVHTARLERELILKALREENFNVTRAARRLGISRKSLQTKMKDYGLRQGG